jgi:hypothetical protein
MYDFFHRFHCAVYDSLVACLRSVRRCIRAVIGVVFPVTLDILILPSAILTVNDFPSGDTPLYDQRGITLHLAKIDTRRMSV